jgi:hypothetical protein
MSHFRPVEVEALHLLVEPVLGAEKTRIIVRDAQFVDYEYSGCGYFLTVKHDLVPKDRVVCGATMVVARAGEVEGGYIAFLENGELMLECYTAGAVDVPEGFRDLRVEITQPNKSLERTREG